MAFFTALQPGAGRARSLTALPAVVLLGTVALSACPSTIARRDRRTSIERSRWSTTPDIAGGAGVP